jgi:hypothetical protein
LIEQNMGIDTWAMVDAIFLRQPVRIGTFAARSLMPCAHVVSAWCRRTTVESATASGHAASDVCDLSDF